MSEHPSQEGRGPIDRVIVVGASAGGIRSLTTLLEELPREFPVPIVIVQHRSEEYNSHLVSLLARHSNLPVKSAREAEPLEPGAVYVSRADRHLTISGDDRFTYWDGARVRHVLSSANLLFESAAVRFGRGAIGVVLSGTGSDGTAGAQAIKAHGGTVLAQDVATSEHFGMPMAAIRTGAVDQVLPLEEIAPALLRLVGHEFPDAWTGTGSH